MYNCFVTIWFQLVSCDVCEFFRSCVAFICRVCYLIVTRTRGLVHPVMGGRLQYRLGNDMDPDQFKQNQLPVF